MDLKTDREFSASPVVANCRMNRERVLTGGNSYSRDLGMNPVDFLQTRLESQTTVCWLDLCCGTGRALIEAAEQLDGQRERAEIVGLDLAGLFDSPVEPGVQFVESAIEDWQPSHEFDLITCVHGLHYVGDKLRAIARAVSWLTEDGLFVGHLDLANLRHQSIRAFGRRAVRHLRDTGLDYDTRHRLVLCSGRREVDIPWLYLGADDEAGPNFTGQPAVNSWYADAALEQSEGDIE
jgi:SAM-dependent methyltransferase